MASPSRSKSAAKKVSVKKKATPPPRYYAYLTAVRNSGAFKLFVLWAAAYMILVGFFFAAIIKRLSYIELFPGELLFPCVMHATTALVIALVLYWLPWYRTFLGKLISATLLALLMVGYDTNLKAVSGIIRAFMPGFTDGDPLVFVSLLYMVLLLIFAVATGVFAERFVLRLRRIRPRDVELGVLVFLLYLFVIPTYSLAKIFPTMVREARVQATEFTKPAGPAVADKPDIFYFVFDRYANATTLKEQFNFDNSPITNYLRDNQFRVNDTAYGNYPYTAMSIASTLNAQYTKDLVAPFKQGDAQSRTLYHNLIWQSSVAKALKKEGYKYYELGSWYGSSYKAPLAERDYIWQTLLTVFGKNKRLRGIEGIEFKKSPYYSLALATGAKWWPLKVSEHDHGTNIREQFNILDDLTTKEAPGGRFVFSHILVPHDPFIFNSDGSQSAYPGTDSFGKPIKQKYTGQVEFVNSQIKVLVDNIQKQSGGKAVIIFNSDEGPYPQFLNDTFKKPQGVAQSDFDAILKGENMLEWSEDWLKMKYGVLQAVHIPKATDEDLANLSSVNVFRIVLNRYAGYDLPYLPDCHFGLTNGSENEYLYKDISKTFETNPDKSCASLESTR